MTELDMTAERDLASVEEALSAHAVTATDPDRRELQELALALQLECAAEPDPAFSAKLHERVAADFPSASPSVKDRLQSLLLRSGAWSSSDLLAGGGMVAALLVAIVIAVSFTGDTSSNDGAGGGTRDDGAVLQAPGDAGGGAAPDTGAAELAPSAPSGDSARSIAPAVPPSRGGSGFSPGREQRIARSAALALEAPADELDTLAERVTAVTDRYRGYVLSSSVTAGDEDEAGGTLELRIPATNLRAAIGDLSKLATVRSSTQGGEDVTGRFVSARDRLDAARAERVGLLRRLAQADTNAEAESIRARLDLVAREIGGLRDQLRQLRLRTNYAAVDVTLSPPDDEAGTAAPSSTEDAFDDALGSLVGALNLGLRLLGVALPLGLVALLAWSPARALRRRRRESALA